MTVGRPPRPGCEWRIGQIGARSDDLDPGTGGGRTVGRDAHGRDPRTGRHRFPRAWRFWPGISATAPN